MQGQQKYSFIHSILTYTKITRTPNFFYYFLRHVSVFIATILRYRIQVHSYVQDTSTQLCTGHKYIVMYRTQLHGFMYLCPLPYDGRNYHGNVPQEIIIKELRVLCVCAGQIANDRPAQRDCVAQNNSIPSLPCLQTEVKGQLQASAALPAVPVE